MNLLRSKKCTILTKLVQYLDKIIFKIILTRIKFKLKKNKNL